MIVSTASVIPDLVVQAPAIVVAPIIVATTILGITYEVEQLSTMEIKLFICDSTPFPSLAKKNLGDFLSTIVE